MASSSKIEWCDTTWNPSTGCTKVSPGCTNCYALDMAGRLKGMNNRRYENGFSFTHHPDKLSEPKTIRTPKRIFVNSQSDVLHEEMRPEFLYAMFKQMNEADWHIYMMLTKRGERLAEVGPALPWNDHIWMGVSVECGQTYGTKGLRPTDRIDQLRQSGAKVKFLSVEPLIGRVPYLDLEGIDWVIIGGESGPKAREMKLEWELEVFQQCREADVPVFVKQLGRVWAKQNGSRDPKGGQMEDWPQILRVREWPHCFEALWQEHQNRAPRRKSTDRPSREPHPLTENIIYHKSENV